MVTVQQWVDNAFDNADSDRTKWQLSCLVKWANNGYKGSVEAGTGTGKTRIAIHAIQLLKRNDDTRRAIVVVPTRVLKSQWERELRKWKITVNVEVWVVNSYIKGLHRCDLLILDEIHRMAADTFSTSFDVTEYGFVLGLTATMSRLDGKHHLLQHYAPVITKLSIEQARAKGWVANYKEYWLGLELNEEDREYYENKQKQFQKFFRVFGMDFDLVKQATGDLHLRVSIARRLDISPEYVYIAAVNTLRTIRDIRKWVIDHPMKIDAAETIINHFDRKTLTFGDSIKVANQLAKRLGDKAMAFHSEMKPIEKETFKDKEYKTEAGARRAAERLGGEYKFKHGKHIMQLRVMKRLSGKKLKEYVLHKIANTQQLQTVCTAKSLNEGFDFPGAELGITLSRPSSPTTYIQTTGRIVRLSEGHSPIMIHIYLKDTKDSQWLFKAGRDAVGAIRVDSVEELFDHIKSREDDLDN